MYSKGIGYTYTYIHSIFFFKILCPQVGILTLPLNSCVTLGKLLNLSVPRLPRKPGMVMIYSYLIVAAKWVNAYKQLDQCLLSPLLNVGYCHYSSSYHQYPNRWSQRNWLSFMTKLQSGKNPAFKLRPSDLKPGWSFFMPHSCLLREGF